MIFSLVQGLRVALFYGTRDVDGFDDQIQEDMMTPTEYRFPGFDGMDIYGHLSLPEGPEPFPAVLVLCGDPGGAKDQTGQYSKIVEHRMLAPEGFAVFTVDHRGSTGHGDDFYARQDLGGDDLLDVLVATRYLADRRSMPGASRFSAVAAARIWRRWPSSIAGTTGPRS